MRSTFHSLVLMSLALGASLLSLPAGAALPKEALDARNASAVHFTLNVESLTVEAKAPSIAGDATCVVKGVVREVFSRGLNPLGVVAKPEARVAAERAKLKEGAGVIVDVPCVSQGGMVGPSVWAMPVPKTRVTRLELWGDYRPRGDRIVFVPFDARAD